MLQDARQNYCIERRTTVGIPNDGRKKYWITVENIKGNIFVIFFKVYIGYLLRGNFLMEINFYHFMYSY